ncbi:MAG: hypothetical protein WC156_09245 [Pedobacter sp.]
MLVALITTGTALSLVSLVLIGTEVQRYHRDIIRNTSIIADMVSYSATTSLMFADPKGGSDALSPLSAKPAFGAWAKTSILSIRSCRMDSVSDSVPGNHIRIS